MLKETAVGFYLLFPESAGKRVGEGRTGCGPGIREHRDIRVAPEPEALGEGLYGAGFPPRPGAFFSLFRRKLHFAGTVVPFSSRREREKRGAERRAEKRKKDRRLPAHRHLR